LQRILREIFLNAFVARTVTKNNTNKGKFFEQREGFHMLMKLNDCLTVEIGPPQFLLNATTGLLRLYPLFLKASLLLQRFVQ